jgi:hypothetical protein
MFILSRKPKKNRRIQWGISKVENQRTTGGYKGVIESRKPKNRWIQRGNRNRKSKKNRPMAKRVNKDPQNIT